MLDLEIRKQINRYLDPKGDVEAAELEAWLAAEAWDIDDEPQATRQLAFDAMRLLAERGNGDWDDAELRERLGALSRTYWFVTAPKTDSVATVIRRDPRLPATDRRHVAEFA